MKTLFLIRHSEAKGFPRSLTQKGIELAKQSGSWLKAILPKKFISLVSPIQRAVQTADIISQKTLQPFRNEALLSIKTSPEKITSYLGSFPNNCILAISHQPLLFLVCRKLSRKTFFFPNASICELTLSPGESLWKIKRTFTPLSSLTLK